MQICTCELPPILRWFTRTKTGTRGRGIGSRPAAKSIQGRTNRCKCVTNIMFVLYHLERRDFFCPGGGIRAILFAFVCHAKRSLLGFRHAKREKGSPRQAKRTFSGGRARESATRGGFLREAPQETATPSASRRSLGEVHKSAQLECPFVCSGFEHEPTPPAPSLAVVQLPKPDARGTRTHRHGVERLEVLDAVPTRLLPSL